jgi:hypothetical protein
VNCLEKYRSKLIREINRELRLVYVQPDESAVHDFRVGMKRLSALFYFLNSIEPGLDSKSLLKPYRVCSNPIASSTNPSATFATRTSPSNCCKASKASEPLN